MQDDPDPAPATFTVRELAGPLLLASLAPMLIFMDFLPFEMGLGAGLFVCGVLCFSGLVLVVVSDVLGLVGKARRRVLAWAAVLLGVGIGFLPATTSAAFVFVLLMASSGYIVSGELRMPFLGPPLF